MVCINPVTLKSGWKDTNEFCKKYADEVYKKIPKKSCDKNKLVSIILVCDIASSTEAIDVLEGKLKYLGRIFGTSPDDSGIHNPEDLEAHMDYTAIYEKMIDSVKKYCK